ncbi:MAG: TldD/PmbA family protein [Spirochaetaceae bacterium]|jgi:TldD protein|nr:TldD/PmbA family protein [Spirochaetaceae bacterium]
MNVKMSEFLKQQKKHLKKLVENLSEDFPYVSILGTDTKGTTYVVKKTGTSINESRWVERGFVARVYNGKGYSEYSFNEIGNLAEVETAIRKTAKDDVELLIGEKINFLEYPLIDDIPVTDTFFGTVETLPDNTSPEEIINSLTSILEKGLTLSESLIDIRVMFDYANISKIFISNNKDLEQAYVWSNAYIIPIGRNEKGVKYSLNTVSGLKGSEILKELSTKLEGAISDMEALLSSEPVVPGVYDIICDTAMAGLIAHEAFGHGVEMDMFVKKRAKAMEYMNKTVASLKVQMFDGAKSAIQVSSFLFDDEGTLGTDIQIIKDGILKAGLSDLLSALKLGTTPTGNGKRQSFERKAYARMTNTFFGPGSDSVEDMIKSITKGYLLESYSSGMEDPKNWGIQCVASRGREIINGELTGKVVSPVYLTGYVPDLLQDITMLSENVELKGSGACGKGYKEMVKTSIGGPFLKTRGRLA